MGALLLWTAGLAFAATGDVPRPADISPRNPVEIRSRELTFERGSGLTRFSGDVLVTHGNLRMQADEVRAASGNRQATAEGHVTAVDAGMAATLTCGHLEYRDLMQVITAHDSPMLTSVDDNLRPVSLTSRQMEFYSDRKEAVAHQDVVMTSSEGYAVAGKATLLQEKGEVLLEGEPRVFTTQGDFSGRRLKLNMRENRYEAEGGVEVNFYPTPQARPPSPPAPGTAAPAGIPFGSPGPATPVPDASSAGTASPGAGTASPGAGKGPSPDWSGFFKNGGR
jgi:lipopolysaccharide export system protein LptA